MYFTYRIIYSDSAKKDCLANVRRGDIYIYIYRCVCVCACVCVCVCVCRSRFPQLLYMYFTYRIIYSDTAKKDCLANVRRGDIYIYIYV